MKKSIDFKKSSLKGQAIVELGILGALLILLLGTLISYGLANNFQQRIIQQTFRKALQSAAVSVNPGTPLSVSHIVIRDRHIPDPANLFGRGQVMPFFSSASVTRYYQLETASAEGDNELPRIVIDIQGTTDKKKIQFEFKTAGFQYVSGVTEEKLEDYFVVFGQTNIFGLGKDRGWWPVNSDQVAKTCNDSMIGFECSNYAITQIRILDYCAGEVGDEQACRKQCDEIHDNGLNVPCAHHSDQPLISPSYTRDLREDNTLTIQTGKSGITTTDQFKWEVITTRTITPTGEKHQSKVDEDKPVTKTTSW